MEREHLVWVILGGASRSAPGYLFHASSVERLVPNRWRSERVNPVTLPARYRERFCTGGLPYGRATAASRTR